MKELEQQQASTGSVIVARLCHKLSHSGSTPESFLGGGDTTGAQAVVSQFRRAHGS
jgi:hypothetical protein